MLNSQATKAVHRLVRHDALTLTDWVRFIEDRRALIEPHLREMNLKDIGTLRIADFSSRRVVLNTQKNVVVEGDYGLDMRCAFPRGEGLSRDTVPSVIDFVYDPPGSSPAKGGRERFWALARSGRFITIDVRFWYEPGIDYKNRPCEWVCVEKVSIRKCPLPELFVNMKLRPEKMWLQLGQIAQDWYQDRKNLLYGAKRLAETCAFEEELYGLSHG